MFTRLRSALQTLLLAAASLWRLHPPALVVVQAAPAVIVQTLKAAARPSTERLHLRDLFRDGLRYHIEPLQNGFRITSTAREAHGGRRRTRVAAVLVGVFSSAAGEITFVRLQTRMNLPYFLSGLAIPAFITSIIIYMPWGRGTVLLLVALLFGLSLGARRLNAALQAAEMVYFVQKALEDLPQPEIMALEASHPEIVMAGGGESVQTDFGAQWQKFYRRQTEHGSA
jgi:hypothetical protein